MPNPFLIPKIPDDAEYYITPAFFQKSGSKRLDLANRLQVVDPRFGKGFSNRFRSKHFDPSILEIEDQIISRAVSPILCSTAIFKSHHRHGNEEWWQKYVNDIKEKIEHYASSDYGQLRIYVGNSMWQDLDDAGILKSPGVDFIKMKDSSMGWNIGNMWRILALTDYSYDYVFFADLHQRARFELLAKRLSREIFYNTDAPIAASLVDPPTQDLTFVMQLRASFFNNISGHFYLPICQILPIESFLKTKIFEWFRGPQELPFTDLPRIILDCLNKRAMNQVYDPELNRWTYMHPHCQMYQEADSAEKIMFFLSKALKMKLWIRDEHLDWYRRGYKAFGDNFFWKRMIEQVNCDFMCSHNGGKPFDWKELTDG